MARRHPVANHGQPSSKGTRGKPRADQSGGKPPHSQRSQARMRSAHAKDGVVGSTFCQGFSSGFFASLGFPMNCCVCTEKSWKSEKVCSMMVRRFP